MRDVIVILIAVIALNVYFDWCDRNGTLDLSIPPVDNNT